MLIQYDHQQDWEYFRQEGNETAFKAIYDYYFHPLFNYGMRFCNDLQIAEDTVQDLFTKLWTNKKNIKQTASVKNYLYKAYRRILIAKLQTISKKRTEVHDEQETKFSFDFQLSYEQLWIKKEESSATKQKLNKALSLLNERHKEILYLRFYEELSQKQIAEIMSVSTKSSYKLLYRALDKLRQHIEMICVMLFFGCLKKSWFQ